MTCRIIACLDCLNGRVIKGVRFKNLLDSGDPASLAEAYEAQGADEIVVLDVSATIEMRRAHLDTIRAIRSRLSIPLTVGGGINSSAGVAQLLEAGADKVSVNSAAVAHPPLLSELSREYGSQCIVLAVDALGKKAGSNASPLWEVTTHSATQKVDLDVITWAQAAVELGAGEILLTSVDRDGTGLGYDVDLIQAVSSVVSVPIIASGGAAEYKHLSDALSAGASAVLVASLLHFNRLSIAEMKSFLQRQGVSVRL